MAKKKSSHRGETPQFHSQGLVHPDYPNLIRCIPVDSVTWRVPLQTVPAHYFDVYNALFLFENLFRTFVYAALKAQYGKDWLYRPTGKKKEGDPHVKPPIVSVTDAEIDKQTKYSYLGEESKIPMLYLDFGQLVGIMDNERSVFRRILKGAVGTFISKLDEVRAIRNNMAHFRKVTEDDYQRLERCLADVTPPMREYLSEITVDLEKFYQEDAPELAGLQARIKQLLDGVEHFDIRIARSTNWTGITLRQSFRQTIHRPLGGPQWVWILDPGYLIVALHEAGVYGSVVCYMSNGEYRRTGNTGAISGSLSVRYVLPWKFENQTPTPEVAKFVEALAREARRLDEEYRNAEIDPPRHLAKKETRDLADAEFHPHISPLCPRYTNITEDWTGEWDTGLPWIDEEVDRSNQMVAELLAESGGDLFAVLSRVQAATAAREARNRKRRA